MGKKGHVAIYFYSSRKFLDTIFFASGHAWKRSVPCSEKQVV